jgi:signal transduction histidine kinase
MTATLSAPTDSSPLPAGERPVRAQRQETAGLLPLFWRLLGINLAVVLGGAVVGTWLTQRLVLSGSFTPITHALLVLAAVCLSAGLSVLLLRQTYAAAIREKTDQAERLAARVIMAQEEERKRVARELHDEAGQALTAVIIGLERGLASMPEQYAADLPIQPRQLISNLRDLAAQTLDEVRKLALELRPSVLDDLGLVAALRQYVRSTEERSGLPIHVWIVGWDDSDARLPPEMETALFRIAQEALTNTIRHARASSVQLRLRRDTRAVTLEICDDGVGLESGTPPRAGEHLGMFGMGERARLLGGEFHAGTVSPHGTMIQVRIPLAP